MEETSLATLHGKKGMLKYMHLLSQSSIACDKFARGRGVKVIRELMDEAELRKDTMDVARKMLEGAKSSTRTEMVMQFEEAGTCTKLLSARCAACMQVNLLLTSNLLHAFVGIIPAIFAHLKDQKEPVPLKVAAVELIKTMQADEDEASADAITAAVDRYPEVRSCHFAARRLCLAGLIRPLTFRLTDRVVCSGQNSVTPSTTCFSRQVVIFCCSKAAAWRLYCSQMVAPAGMCHPVVPTERMKRYESRQTRLLLSQKHHRSSRSHHGCIMPDHVERYSDNYATRLALPWFS